jgi:hypothetical protein
MLPNRPQTESMNQTDRHSQLSPIGELANIARFGRQSLVAQGRQDGVQEGPQAAGHQRFG